MSTDTRRETTDDIVRRMEGQRAQLRQQFAPKPAVASISSTAMTPVQAPHEYKSLVMRVLVANPHLLRRLLIVVASTALGARYSSWTLKLVGYLMAARHRRTLTS